MQKYYKYLKNSEPYWPNESVYFLTESTFLHFPYFKQLEQKQIVLNQIIKIDKKLGIPVLDYSIAQNHLHTKFYLKNGKELSKVKQLLRGGISFEYRKKFKMPYKDMWQSRKTIIVLSEEMNWRVSGYIIGNLLKHKEVSTFKELKENEFSSYSYAVNRYGEGEAQALVRRVIAVDEDEESEVDMEGLKLCSQAKACRTLS